MKMAATQFRGGAPSAGFRTRTSNHNSITKKDGMFNSLHQTEARNFVALNNRKDLSNANVEGGCNLSYTHRSLYSRLVTHRRRTRFPVVSNQMSSDYGVGCSEVEEKLILEEVYSPLTTPSDEP